MSRRGPNDYTFDADYYAILGVDPEATVAEIRRTYRRLALEAHPDKNPERREWAERRIRELIVAYEILSDETKRRAFDAFLRASRGPDRSAEPFFFHRRTPGSRALLILHHLTKGSPSEASVLLEEMEEEFGGDFLYDYLAQSDYLDCLFLLAEYHIREKSFLAAAQRLRTFYHHECQARQPRHYLDQVVDLLRDLYLRKFPKILEPSLQVTYLVEAAEFCLARKDEILRLRLLIEAAADSGNRAIAFEALEKLRELAPESSEVSRLEPLVEGCVDPDSGRRRRAIKARVGKEK